MKRLLTFAMAALIGLGTMLAADAKKPKIILFPSDDWCINKGYMLDANTPDYERAMRDEDMDGAVAVMGDMMAELGYEMFSLKQELKNLHTEAAFRTSVQSKGDGTIMESDRDLITRNVGVDFMVELTLNVKPSGARRTVEFKVATIDAASNKILHGDVGSSKASSGPISLLVKEAVNGYFENFCDKIDLAFTNIEKKGREGSITIEIADDCPLCFEDEITVDGESGELADYITYWLEERAVDGNCSLTHKSREQMRLDQVRFPLFAQVAAGGFGSKKGKVKALTMEEFIKPIATDLGRLGVSVTTVPIGQGKVFVVLGGK